jgi:sec-independent protein translocase protein TatC
LGYLVLPLAVKALLGFTPSSLNNLVRFDDYLSFVLRLILVFGGAFELPVLLVALNLAGVLTGKGTRSNLGVSQSLGSLSLPQPSRRLAIR